MQNPNHIRLPENILEEDKFHNEGLISFIDNDYVLNFINDPESAQRRPLPQANAFNAMIGDMQMPFPNFPDAQKNTESFPNIYGKLNIQDAWFLQNMNEANKVMNAVPRPMNFKIENNQEVDGGIKTKKIKLDKDQMVRKAVDVTNSKGKNNIKNTYINKINSLINEPKASLKSEENKQAEIAGNIEIKKPLVIKNEVENPGAPRGGAVADGSQKGGLKKVRSYDVLKSDEIEKLNVKLARNRESARNSRKRKKVYIDLLEKKVSQLQQELTSARKQLELNNTSFTKLCGQSKLMSSLYSGKQQLFEKLDKMVSNKNDETEISLLIDSLRFRLGATGKERTSAINFFFKQIIEFIVPVHMKYLLLTAAEGKDLFSSKDTTLINNIPAGVIGKNDLQNETTEYWTDLINQVNLTDQQKKAMLKYRKKLSAEKVKFEGIINSLNQVRKNLLKESSSLQDVVDEFRNILSPVQTGKFLLLMDKERNRKEFSSEKLWNNVFTKKELEDKEGSEGSDTFMEDLEGGLQDDNAQSEGPIEGMGN